MTLNRRVVEKVSIRWFRSPANSNMSSEPKGSLKWWNETTWNVGSMGWKVLEDNAWPFADNLKFCGVTESEAAGMKVLIPLCGDTAAVPVLAGMGMEVTAVEGSDKALEELKKRIADILKDDVDSQKRITVLEGDFFKLMSEVPDSSFDLIYDRGSLVAITSDVRQQYVEIMNRVAKPTCRMFFEGIIRNSSFNGDRDDTSQLHIEGGPPHHIEPTTAKKLYPSWEYVLDEKSHAKAVGVPPEVPFASYRSKLIQKA